MSKHNSQQREKRARAEEAARILRALDENPDDPVALKQKAEFIARGEAERRTFKMITEVYARVPDKLKAKDASRRKLSFALVGALLASLYFAAEPLRIAFLADHRTGYEVATFALPTGDRVTLDAASALQDNLTGDTRAVDLLQGTGYFVVETKPQRFVVSAGDVQVEVLGTEFEVSILGEDVVITVAKGSVNVRYDEDDVILGLGDRFRISPSGSVVETVADAAIADWREGQLTIDGMQFGQVASVIDRRMAGKVIVLGSRLRSDLVAGVLDLSEPENALRTLAASNGASVRQASPFLTIISTK